MQLSTLHRFFFLNLFSPRKGGDAALTLSWFRIKRCESSGRQGGATVIMLIFAGWLPQVGFRPERLPLSKDGRRPKWTCP